MLMMMTVTLIIIWMVTMVMMIIIIMRDDGGGSTRDDNYGTCEDCAGGRRGDISCWWKYAVVVASDSDSYDHYKDVVVFCDGYSTDYDSSVMA